jgi:glycosyltransferase involved in cell wall biosynthesis
MPLVSVIIPNYNHEKYLAGRLQSIFQQTYNNLEIICLDDASTDNSLNILESHQQKQNLILIKNLQNSGNPFIQWNKGIRAAKGEYIWIAESDDFADPHLLESLIPILNNNPNVGLAYCQSYFIDEDDEILGTHLKDLERLNELQWQKDFILDGREVLASYMSVFNIIPNASGVLFRKEIFRRIGGASQEMILCGDWLTWSKMLTISDIGFVALPLNYFRVHDHSLRAKIHQKETYIMECLTVIKFIFDCTNINGRSKKKSVTRLMKQWLTIIINQPKSVSVSGALKIFRKSYGLFGFFYASLFLLSSLISLVPLASKIPKVIRKMKRICSK